MLQYGVNNTLPSATAVTVNGGTLDLNAYSGVVGAVTLANGTVIGGTSSTFTGTSYNLQSGTVSVALGGGAASI